MPWMVPSHTAPILPLKMWKPRAFSGLALCLGALAPDLDFVLRVANDWVVSHYFMGQFFFTVPVVMILHALLTTLVLPWLVPLLPYGRPWHLEELAGIRPATSTADWIRVATSGLIGGMSHIFLDGFTHGTHSGWAVPHLPLLRTEIPWPGGAMPLHDFLQIALTIVLGAAGVWGASIIGRRRLISEWNGSAAPELPSATASEKRGAIGYFGLCGAIGILVGLQRAATGTEGGWIEMAAFGALAVGFYGLLLACLFDRLRISLGARKTAPTPIEG